MACFTKSENNSTKGILNLLEFSQVIFIHTIKMELQWSIHLLIIEFDNMAAVSTLRNLRIRLKSLR